MNANLLFDCQNKKESQNVDSFQKPSTPSPLYPALAARSLRGKARHRACLSSSFVNSSDCLKPSQMNWDERNCRSAGKGFRPQLSRATQALRGCLRFPTSVPHLPGLCPPSKGFRKKRPQKKCHCETWGVLDLLFPPWHQGACLLPEGSLPKLGKDSFPVFGDPVHRHAHSCSPGSQTIGVL